MSIDIRNAFNITKWKNCIEAMMRKKVPDYLLRMTDDYLRDGWLIYEGDKLFCSQSQKSFSNQIIIGIVTNSRRSESIAHCADYSYVIPDVRNLTIWKNIIEGFPGFYQSIDGFVHPLNFSNES